MDSRSVVKSSSRIGGGRAAIRARLRSLNFMRNRMKLGASVEEAIMATPTSGRLGSMAAPKYCSHLEGTSATLQFQLHPSS